MSHGTYVPDHSMYPWPQYSQQNGTHQNPLPPVAKTNGQVNSRPVQRFDSTGTSDISNDPYSAYSTTSSFNYEHPTPGDSVDDDTHTPEIQDLLWQETYKETTGHTLDAGYHDSTVDDQDSSFTDQLMRSARNSLPSPESTNTATPEATGHSQKPSMNSTIFTSPLSTPLQPKRPLNVLHTEMSDLHDSTSHLYTPAPSSSRIASPVIHISRHSRGDSPARSECEVPRLAKKRSASNLSQGEYFPDVLTTGQSSMLAPPSQDILPLSDDDEEQRSGIGPSQRNDQEIPSIEDIENQQEHEKKVAEVQNWLQETTLDPSAAQRRRARALSKPDRIRSRSTGARPQAAHNPIFVAQNIPGPGCMIDEQSEYYYSSDSGSSLDPSDHPETLPAEIPPRQENSVAPEDQEPLPKQFFKARPWQDPFLTRAPDNSVRYQPHTSSAAMREFMEMVKDSETASRAATWGTSRRRLSDADKDSIAPGEIKPRHGSLSRTISRRTKELQNKAKEQLLKRSNSHQKRQQQHLLEHPELEPVQSPEPIEERSSTESIKQARQGSYPKPMSPSISAGLLGATNSLTAVGAGSTGLAIETDHHQEGLLRKALRRVRSKSDVNRSPKSPVGATGFTSMIAQQGGMPVPTLASPSQEMVAPSPQQAQPPTSHPVADFEEISNQAGSPVKMTLSPQPTHILPTLDGFKLQIRELNPRLDHYLVERIAHDQIRRYKRLVKNKVDHMAAVESGKCTSGRLCPALGGEAEVLPARSGGANPTSASAQFKIAPGADSDNEDSAFDGIVTPAAFPPGIPLPPTKRLPARFECPLCFQVKSFQKPSDWTKHVHEDVQPFTCTFPNCSEPKSFKRKADWVRHENERHRHLEWWKCNINECTHQCFRKDNFVQHLVREHKRKEPKVKGRGSGNAKGKGKNSTSGFNQEELEFWNLVDTCRHEGSNEAKSEPCKFCDNHCASWKKLSVHVGKHMECIAMPVLDLAQRRNVTKDTIISPVEPPPSRGIPYLAHEQTTMSDIHSAVSPHTQSGTSYPSSSAGHSPLITNRPTGMVQTQSMFTTNYVQNSVPNSSVMYSQTGYPSNPGYVAYIGPEDTGFGPYGGQRSVYSQTTLSPDQYGQRLQSMDSNYVSMDSAFQNSPHQAYFSSPEMEQSYPYGLNLMQVNGNMGVNVSMGGQQMSTPVTSQPMSGNVFVYGAQQPNHHTQYSPY